MEYIDVAADKAQLETMLGYSGGSRRIPVIVDGGSVSVGFNGRS